MRAAGSALTVQEVLEEISWRHPLDRVHVQVGPDGVLLPAVEVGALGDGGRLVVRCLDGRAGWALDRGAVEDLAEALTWVVEEADSLEQVRTEARRLLKAHRLGA